MSNETESQAAGETTSQSSSRVISDVYNELRGLARHWLTHEKPGQTLQPTALVHEAYLRLVKPEDSRNWVNRAQFFAAAAEAMRRILVENARRKKRVKHGGVLQRVELEDPEIAGRLSAEELLDLDDALVRLTQEDAEAAQIVKLHFFGGVSIEEVAETLGISRATAYRQWAYARAWLRCAMGATADLPQANPLKESE